VEQLPVVTVGEARMRVTTRTRRGGESPYIQAGAPRHCFLLRCGAGFTEACVHGEDGGYYCSFVCADEARKVDLSDMQDLPRKRA
jgi:hypothetical protein